MNISSVKLSQVSKVLVLSLVIGVSSIAIGADSVDVDSIVKAIRTSNAGQTEQRKDIQFTPVKLTQFLGDEVNEPTSRNLGHLLMDFRTIFSDQLELINRLQSSALARDPEFSSHVAKEAFSAFKWVYGVATADKSGEVIKAKAAELARQTWLMQTLIDYGIISKSYLSVYSAMDAKLSEENTQKIIELEDKLKQDLHEKEIDIIKKNADFSSSELQLTQEKATLDKLAAEEKNEARKKETLQLISGVQQKISELGVTQAKAVAANQKEIDDLKVAFEKRKTDLESAKRITLDELTKKYGYIFEKLGATGGKTLYRWAWGHETVRSRYKEFGDLDKVLSNDFKDLYPQARKDILVKLFSQVPLESEVEITESVRQSKVLKSLLGIQDDEYAKVITEIRDLEQNKKIILQEQVQEVATVEEVVTALNTTSLAKEQSPKGSETMQSQSSQPSGSESKAALTVATAVLDTLKEKKNEITDAALDINEDAPVGLAPFFSETDVHELGGQVENASQPTPPNLLSPRGTNPMSFGFALASLDPLGASTSGLRRRVAGSTSQEIRLYPEWYQNQTVPQLGNDGKKKIAANQPIVTMDGDVIPSSSDESTEDNSFFLDTLTPMPGSPSPDSSMPASTPDMSATNEELFQNEVHQVASKQVEQPKKSVWPGKFINAGLVAGAFAILGAAITYQ